MCETVTMAITIIIIMTVTMINDNNNMIIARINNDTIILTAIIDCKLSYDI